MPSPWLRPGSWRRLWSCSAASRSRQGPGAILSSSMTGSRIIAECFTFLDNITDKPTVLKLIDTLRMRTVIASKIYLPVVAIQKGQVWSKRRKNMKMLTTTTKNL